MKKGVFFLLLIVVYSCSTIKSTTSSNKLYDILLTKDYGGAAFQFYEVLTEPNEFQMLLNDKELKSKLNKSDIETSNFIIVNLGAKQLEGYTIEIEKIEEFPDKIVVDIKEIEPKTNGESSTTNPYFVLKINSKKTIEIKE
jgi:hypothetical protein